MATNAKPVYKHILLRLNDEALQGTEGLGIDTSILDRMAQETKELVGLGTQVGVAIGGGNLSRGAGPVKAGVNRAMGDHMGTLATVMNDLIVHDALHYTYVGARLMSAIPLNGVCDSYSWAETISLLRSNRVAILSADTGNPFFTIDSATYLRDIEIEADVALKATEVSGVFAADPAGDSAATMYERLAYSEMSEKEPKVMDLAALTLARNHRLPTRVFNMNRPGALRRVAMGEKEGILITEQFP